MNFKRYVNKKDNKTWDGMICPVCQSTHTRLGATILSNWKLYRKPRTKIYFKCYNCDSTFFGYSLMLYVRKTGQDHLFQNDEDRTIYELCHKSALKRWYYRQNKENKKKSRNKLIGTCSCPVCNSPIVGRQWEKNEKTGLFLHCFHCSLRVFGNAPLLWLQEQEKLGKLQLAIPLDEWWEWPNIIQRQRKGRRGRPAKKKS